jgi:2,3-bisphosphoglycerate-independent phosphoglycerate mutase
MGLLIVFHGRTKLYLCKKMERREMNQKLILMILDGWGVGDGSASDVIATAPTPFMDSLADDPSVAYSRLKACGEDVGLPDGQMGNSEVGHLNIGAGRVVYQDLVRINKSVEDGSMRENRVLAEAFGYAMAEGKKVHLLGLVSDGGVHAATPHLYKLIEVAEASGLKDVFVHVLTDGRDTDPRSGAGYLAELEHFLSGRPTRIASVCGRYYTMDRDKRWDRVKRGYDLLVSGTGTPFTSAAEAIGHSYAAGATDEFIEPSVIVDEAGKPLATVEEGDVFICFNFRTDRLREITTALTQRDMPEHGMYTVPLHYLTMAVYDDSFKGIKVIFDKVLVSNTLGEVMERYGIPQIRIAETEKYPHVTFFFSGGREEPFEGEQRIMIPSPREVATYDLKPSMSAPEIAAAIIGALKKGEAGFICLNFANGDMVGHTGVYEAIREAVETVDRCARQVATEATKAGYAVIITADHGNADYAINPDGSPNTAHSLNEVPFYLLNTQWNKMANGRLSDIAPTILEVMGLPVPEVMTGRSLLLTHP